MSFDRQKRGYYPISWMATLMLFCTGMKGIVSSNENDIKVFADLLLLSYEPFQSETSNKFKFKGPVINYRERVAYTMGKSQVSNCLIPSSSRQGKTCHVSPPLKNWKLFAAPPPLLQYG